jgi:hypothetical protein|tara:strand:- start:416 stop:607 length:192 start_codon:yes stop_codon:yes gene_type:complete
MRTSNWVFSKANKKIPRLVPPREIKRRPTKNREELEAEVAAFLKKGGKIQYIKHTFENREQNK